MPMLHKAATIQQLISTSAKTKTAVSQRTLASQHSTANQHSRARTNKHGAIQLQHTMQDKTSSQHPRSIAS